MHLAFYKGQYGGKFDKAICWWTSSPYSHVEMWLDGPAHTARCFSSSPRDGGTRFTTIDLDSGKWDAIKVPTRVGDQKLIERYIAELGHRNYDWLGILGFVFILPFKNHDDEDLFCSEVCLELLHCIGHFLFVKPWKSSPGGHAPLRRSRGLAELAGSQWGAPVPIPPVTGTIV